jgi:hypothetical protein
MNEAAQDEALDFGYRPAIGALVDRLKGKLGHQCLQRQLTLEEDNQVSCLVVEARKADTCSCNPEDARMPIDEKHREAVLREVDARLPDGDADCFCAVPQLEGDELAACQNEKGDPLVVDGAQANGWCYIDATSVPPVGSPELVPESCVSTERRLVRLIGTAKARPESALFVMCSEG